MKRYIPLIFAEGATVMAVELCGAKLMAPVYGNSLYVWATILAITLSALAFGYYAGGVLTKRITLTQTLYNVITFACISIALMPFIAAYILPHVSYLPFTAAVIISACLLIMAPVFFLGCTSPLFIRINSDSLETAGLVSGKVYALSTIGGIISTFICGFIFIPSLGLKTTLLSYATVLFIISNITFRKFMFGKTTLFLATLLISILFEVQQANVLFSKHGILGEISIKQYHKDGMTVRSLLINDVVQTEMDCATGLSVSEYTAILDSLIPKAQQKENALLLGLGGGLVANMLHMKNYSVEGVEFDNRIIAAAKTYFNLHPSVMTIDQDARFYMNKLNATYKYIILDLFKAEEQPGHVLTSESIQELMQHLAPGGKIMVNWHGFKTLPLGQGTHILCNTFRQKGFSVNEFRTSEDENYSNTILVFAPSESTPDIEPNAPLSTDDRPVLEVANARANLQWRKSYLRYYQGQR